MQTDAYHFDSADLSVGAAYVDQPHQSQSFPDFGLPTTGHGIASSSVLRTLMSATAVALVRKPAARVPALMAPWPLRPLTRTRGRRWDDPPAENRAADGPDALMFTVCKLLPAGPVPWPLDASVAAIMCKPQQYGQATAECCRSR